MNSFLRKKVDSVREAEKTLNKNFINVSDILESFLNHSKVKSVEVLDEELILKISKLDEIEGCSIDTFSDMMSGNYISYCSLYYSMNFYKADKDCNKVYAIINVCNYKDEKKINIISDLVVELDTKLEDEESLWLDLISDMVRVDKTVSFTSRVSKELISYNLSFDSISEGFILEVNLTDETLEYNDDSEEVEDLDIIEFLISEESRVEFLKGLFEFIDDSYKAIY